MLYTPSHVYVLALTLTLLLNSRHNLFFSLFPPFSLVLSLSHTYCLFLSLPFYYPTHPPLTVNNCLPPSLTLPPLLSLPTSFPPPYSPSLPLSLPLTLPSSSSLPLSLLPSLSTSSSHSLTPLSHTVAPLTLSNVHTCMCAKSCSYYRQFFSSFHIRCAIPRSKHSNYR